MQKIFNIIIMLTVLYLVLTQKEGMSNTDVKKIINDVYQADINSIRNLSKLANDLTTNGKLVVPGGLEIQGKLKMKGLELYPDGANCLVVKNSNGQAAIGSRNKYYFHIDSNRDVYFYNKSYFAKDVNAENNIKVKKDVNAEGNVKANGNGYFNKKITGENLEIKKDSHFGTAGHKLSIIWSGGKKYGTYFAFYKGKDRTFYMLPYLKGLLYNNGNFESEGYVEAVDKLISKNGLVVKKGGIYAKSHIGTMGRFYTWKNDGIQRGCDKVYENGSGYNCKKVT